jgi:serine/threonine protein kinase
MFWNDSLTSGPDRPVSAPVLAAHSSTPDARIFQRRIGPYRLVSKIGEGGMGAVYKAVHMSLQKVVALKLLAGHQAHSRRAIARFRCEITATARLDHPNVVRATDAGNFEGVYFLALEHIDGICLSRLIGRCGRLSVADACEIVRQAALGLQHIHHCGAIHRDVKPANVMLTRNGQVKIVDLGLALVSDEVEPHSAPANSDELVGSFDYMAPEQARDSRAVNPAADLYGLGATLYQLLTGEPPFAGRQYSSPMKKIHAAASRPAPPVNECRPEIPFELAAVVARLLAKNPTDRFASAAELAQAIAPFSAGSDLVRLAAAADAAAASRCPAQEPAFSTSDVLSSITVDYIPTSEADEIENQAATC